MSKRTPREYWVRLDWDAEDRVWVATVPELDDLSTFGPTREEALDAAREAIGGYIIASEKAGLSLPLNHPKSTCPSGSTT